MDSRLMGIKRELKKFADDYEMRRDWHEPDEHGVSATITGSHLDNAFGVEQNELPQDAQEFVVHLSVDGEQMMAINLADLLAIASTR